MLGICAWGNLSKSTFSMFTAYAGKWSVWTVTGLAFDSLNEPLNELMINEETTLAWKHWTGVINGTDVSTQSWVLISIKNIITARWLYTHRPAGVMTGDEVGRNNVLDGEANNRMGVYTPCTNNVNKKTYGIYWVLLNSKLHSVLQFVRGWDLWIRGSYTDGWGPASWFIVWHSVWMCHASSAHLWRWWGWHATTSAPFHLMACIWSTACSATADWAVFPDVNALLCSFRWCSNVLYTSLANVHLWVGATGNLVDDMVWYGMAWHGMAWHGMAWQVGCDPNLRMLHKSS